MPLLTLFTKIGPFRYALAMAQVVEPFGIGNNGARLAIR